MVVQYGGFTILSSPFFVEGVLPFLLIFALVFALLQKSGVLGKDKKQVDALVALAVGLLVISFGQALGIILQLVAFLAVSLVIVLVFMLLVGSFFKADTFDLPGWTKLVLGIIVFIAVVIAVLVFTGGWAWIMDTIDSSTGIVANVVFVVLVIGAILAVVLSGGKSSSGGEHK
jgi:hypothetical protein